MGQAIVDPQELRRFASRLRHFSTEVHSQMQTVQRQLQALSATWRDQEHLKFAEQFEQTMLVMKRFVEASNEHVPQLLRKAVYGLCELYREKIRSATLVANPGCYPTGAVLAVAPFAVAEVIEKLRSEET